MRLLAWLSPACLPSNGTNYPATWVKQGNIHFRKIVKSREKDTKKKYGAVPNAVCLLWKQLEQTVFLVYLNGLLSRFTPVDPCTSSHHLYPLWFPPLLSVTGQLLRVREGERHQSETFCEFKENK